MIYLAIPYTSKDLLTRSTRFEVANYVAAMFMDQGHTVFSPISHGHVIDPYLKSKTDHKFWMRQCLPFLEISDKLVVVCLDGWKESKGVQEEIKFAELNNIKIEYFALSS